MKATPPPHQYFCLPYEYRPEVEYPDISFPKGGTPLWQFVPSYPSPPMSSPPSPQRKVLERHPPRITFPELDLPSTTTPSSTNSVLSIPAGLAGIPTTAPLTAAQSYIRRTSVSSSNLPRTYSSSSNESTSAIYRTESTSSVSNVPDLLPTAGLGTDTPATSVGRGGRRAKAHVANACNNCKRAHLSCDVDRPCGRCVATGKADTCRDVPHKKRGRPRLRDEGQFQAQPAGIRAEAAVGPEVGPSSIAGRPSSGVRHQRAGSLRTLRAHAGSFTGVQPPTPTIQSASTALGPPPLPAVAPYTGHAPMSRQLRLVPSPDVPIAFLDTDFVILRVNPTFQRLFSWLQEIKGIRLSDIARPLERDSFQNARNQLREEREAREPAYLPPILQPRLDPVSGIDITDHNIENLTRGFNEHQFAWTFRLGGGIDQMLPVRMRLAKTSVYFVTLFLPPLPPQVQSENIAVSLPAPPPVMFPARGAAPIQFQGSPRVLERQQPGISEPPTAYYPFPTVGPGQTHNVQAGSRTYPPPQYQPFSPQMLPPPPSFQPSERTGNPGTSQTLLPPLQQTRPRSETMESLGRHVQTRLRADSGATLQYQSSPARPQQRQQGGEVSEEEEESPNKRRRLDINEMLR